MAQRIALIASLLVPCVTRAQTEVADREPCDVAAAARAFANGQAAELRGADEDAALFYELAYHIAPSPEALRSAIREWHRAGVRARAATLAEELAARYADDPLTSEVTRLVLDGAREALARYAIACDPACAVAIDGRAAELDRELSHVAYIEAGAHIIDVHWDGGRTVRREATIEPGSTLELSFAPPEIGAPPSSPPQRRPHRAPPPARDPNAFVPFAFALGGTLAITGVTIASAIDLAVSGADAGSQARELRTQILGGITSAAIVATAVIAALTDWNGPAWVAPAIAHDGGGVAAGGVLP